MAAWRVNTAIATIASVSMDMARTARGTKAAKDTDNIDVRILIVLDKINNCT